MGTLQRCINPMITDVAGLWPSLVRGASPELRAHLMSCYVPVGINNREEPRGQRKTFSLRIACFRSGSRTFVCSAQAPSIAISHRENER